MTTILKSLRHIPRIFFKKGMPLNLIFFVTSRCNARCRHCFFWRDLNKGEREITLPEIEKIAKSIPHVLAFSLTGGEPFLRDDLPEIVSIFNRFTTMSNLQIPTNGFLTEKIVKTKERILENCRRDVRVVISVSLDDFGEKHDNIRQVPGIWQKAIETIKQLKKLEEQYPNFSVSSCVTVNKDNQESAEKLFDFVKNELKIKNPGANLIRAEVKDMSLKEVDLKYYNNIHSKIRNDFLCQLDKKPKPSMAERILSSRLHLGSQMISRIYSQKKHLTPCYAGDLLAILRENGDVYPCEMLDLKMGNLRDFNFNLRKLWFSERGREVRKRIKKTKCFCTYECAMSLNTLFNPRHLLTILKNALLSKN